MERTCLGDAYSLLTEGTPVVGGEENWGRENIPDLYRQKIIQI